MSGMAISKANKEGICEKTKAVSPFQTLLLSPSLRQHIPLLVQCNTRDFFILLFFFYLCASGEIQQLVRVNGYFRTFPPIAKAAHSIFCKIMDLQNFIVVDCSPLCSAQGILLPHNHSYSESGKLVVNVFLCPHICFMGKEKIKLK